MAEKTTLSGKIAILPVALVNQIAAGEVIERPASVVKELIENSIDAGSTRIEVDVKAGGRLLIRVQDDGEGMCREDALLAFQRHATSKVRTDQDLLSIQTLGFRGEALPSIAAVSKVRMATSPQAGSPPPHPPPEADQAEDQAEGTEVLLEGGHLLKVREAGTPPGTLIEIREIFYNTPARLKFLRSVSTELAHISRLLHQQALAHPQISFRLSHEGKLLADFPSVPERMQRIQQVYGRPFTEHLVVLEDEWAKVKIWGAISRPPYTKSTRSYQEIFVNRRAVSSPFILHAVYEAYDISLLKGQHPVVLLFLEMDGPMLDVNVHPTKREVRFHDQRLIYDLIKESVKTGLERISRAELYPPGSRWDTGKTDHVHEAEPAYLKWDHASPATEVQPPSMRSPAFQEPGLVAPHLADRKTESDLPGLSEQVLPLGQIHNTYIIASIRGELWIIDQHAAHERVLYERFLEGIRSSQIPIQRLLIPQTLELPIAQAMILKEWMGYLESVGIEIESFGHKTLIIRSIPTFLARADLQGLILGLLEDWIDLEKTPSAQDRQNSLVATLACHGAVKANEALTSPEIKALLIDILKLPEAVTCPHGRPLRMKFTLRELEVMFRR
ncbi:MAG TPA: DNA mismatch repair endonuclease MutL [Nitrospiria bacterium]|nr:DNA mismatch repair endonuclease MutL [Nitrospiria bacterium]